MINQKKIKPKIHSHYFLKKNRKGLSAIVTLMILILIVISVGGIIWAIVNNAVKGKLDGASSCYGIIGKVEINSEFTCYDSSAEEMHFSIGVDDIDLDQMIVAISEGTSSKTYTLTNEIQTITNLRNYDGTTDITAPEKNSGKTYIGEGFTEIPKGIEIALVINGNTCGISDSLTNIGLC